MFFYFVFKQLAAYITFAANSAASEAALLAVTGANELQWMKLCNRFTRFCIQIGGALICGFLSSLLMAVISSISAFNLFRLYSPKRFLLFKQTWWSILSLIFSSIFAYTERRICSRSYLYKQICKTPGFRIVFLSVVWMRVLWNLWLIGF